MALHFDGGYTSEQVPASLFDAAQEWADKAQAGGDAAIYRAALEKGWHLTCPKTGMGAAQLPGYWAGQIVRQDRNTIPYALTAEGHEVAGFGGVEPWSEWLPQGILKAERKALARHFEHLAWQAEQAEQAEQVPEQASTVQAWAPNNPFAALAALKR